MGWAASAAATGTGALQCGEVMRSALRMLPMTEGAGEERSLWAALPPPPPVPLLPLPLLPLVFLPLPLPLLLLLLALPAALPLPVPFDGTLGTGTGTGPDTFRSKKLAPPPGRAPGRTGRHKATGGVDGADASGGDGGRGGRG